MRPGLLHGIGIALMLWSFLGLVHYYGKFIPNLAAMLHPMNDLLQKNVKWRWRVWASLSEGLTSSTVLAHYDPQLPLTYGSRYLRLWGWCRDLPCVPKWSWASNCICFSDSDSCWEKLCTDWKRKPSPSSLVFADFTSTCIGVLSPWSQIISSSPPSWGLKRESLHWPQLDYSAGHYFSLHITIRLSTSQLQHMPMQMGYWDCHWTLVLIVRRIGVSRSQADGYLARSSPELRGDVHKTGVGQERFQMSWSLIGIIVQSFP